jgi:septal ring factor EnvC (AmiA/AmiB activator)
LTNSFATAAKDKKLIDDALADAQKQEEACKKDIADSTSDLEKFSRERDVVAAYRDAIKESLASAEAAITRLIDTNKAMAGQIAKFQLEAARRIDQRTRAMAQSGAGRQ